MNLFLIADLLHQSFAPTAALLPGALHSFAHSAAPIAVTAVWQGIAVASSLAIALKLTPRISGAHCFALWSAAFIALLALPAVPMLASHLGSAATQASVAVASAEAHPWLELDFRWSLAIAALWILVACVRAADLVAHSFRLRKLWRTATPVDPQSGVNAHLPASTGRTFEICTTSVLDRPSVIGFFAPRILIPDWLYACLTAGELQQIVLHEAEHLRRRDDWTNLFQKLCLVLFPLNPALWFIEHRLSKEREMACDEAVVRITQSPRAYAACLASLAERGLQRARAEALSLGVWQRRPELVHRVHRILRRKRVLDPVAARVLVGTLACSLVVVALELARCPQLVAFVPSPNPEFAHGGSPLADGPQFGDAVYQSVAARANLRPGYYALPAKAFLSASQTSNPFVDRARTKIHHQKAAAVGELPAPSSEPGISEPGAISSSSQHALNVKAQSAQPDAADAQQFIIFTAWTQVEASSPIAQTMADYDTAASVNPAAKNESLDSDNAPNNPTTSRITVTRLIFRVLPPNSKPASKASPNSGASSALPAAIPFGDGWLVIQL
jgi:beta-lactamase regulating signal transducer with metallopeptidase domain